ncbi:hypothetical protein [Allomuricauda sp. d1]|uniref:hypothetical protein n=1 Tax=Allomuricauda sp. d1 TaxID=3136725 RepID=UPI0031D61399
MKRTLWSLAALIFIGCTTDDGGTGETEKISPADFIAIGEDEGIVYQFSYDADTGAGQTFNLTEELGIRPSYLTLRQQDGLLSFYSFSGGSFSLAQKNVLTGTTLNYNDFYTSDLERSVIWGINTESRVFFGYFGPQTSRNLAIFDLELDGTSAADITLDFNIDAVFQPILFENKVFVAYRDSQGDNKLTYYNIDTKSVGPTLNFGGTAISFLIADSGDIAVVKNGSQPTLELYDSDALSFIESKALDFNSGFESGPIDGAVLAENRLFYRIAYPQPARIPYGPAIFDFGEQDNQIIDVFGLIEEIEREVGASIALTTQIFDSEKNSFFIGYGVLGNEIKGGVLQVDTEGRLVANIEFPFFPTHILRN